MQKRWFSVSEAAEHFSINRKTLYSLIARKMIPEAAILKFGRVYRINVTAIEAQTEEKK